jgi:hypothetical protein
MRDRSAAALPVLQPVVSCVIAGGEPHRPGARPVTGKPFDHTQGQSFAVRNENVVEEFGARGAFGDVRTVRAPGRPLALLAREGIPG